MEFSFQCSRLIITITSLVLAVVASIVAVVAVLAARNVTVNSNVTIKYEAKDIVGGVTTEYMTEYNTTFRHDALTKTPAQTGEATNEVKFNGEEVPNSGTFYVHPSTIALGSSTTPFDLSEDGSHWIVFKFTFENQNQDRTYTATLSATDVAAWNSNGFTVATEEGEKATPFADGFTNDVSDLTITVPTATSDTVYGTAVYYVRLYVTNIKADVTFSGSLTWSLSTDDV